MKEQVSRLAKSAVRRPIWYRISSHFGLTGETLISGWRRKDIILLASLWTVTSLWPQKVSCSSRIYSARAKLKLISDQAGLYASLFGILNKSTVSGKFTRDDLCGESASY